VGPRRRLHHLSVRRELRRGARSRLQRGRAGRGLHHAPVDGDAGRGPCPGHSHARGRQDPGYRHERRHPGHPGDAPPTGAGRAGSGERARVSPRGYLWSLQPLVHVGHGGGSGDPVGAVDPRGPPAGASGRPCDGGGGGAAGGPGGRRPTGRGPGGVRRRLGPALGGGPRADEMARSVRVRRGLRGPVRSVLRAALALLRLALAQHLLREGGRDDRPAEPGAHLCLRGHGAALAHGAGHRRGRHPGSLEGLGGAGGRVEP